MGKIFGKSELKLTAAVLLSLVLLTSGYVSAASRDVELFDKGYGNYLSYQPEKAVEAFRTFLKDFPDSSASDAVMFWLGKSLMQLKSYKEAGNVLSDLRKRFPESPFAVYALREIESIKKAESEQAINRTHTEASSAPAAAVGKEKINDQIQEEKQKAEVLQAKVMEMEEAGKKTVNLEEKAGELETVTKKSEGLQAKVKELEQEKKKADELQLKIKELEEEKKKTETLQGKIQELQWRERYLFNSSYVLNKLGIREVLWSSGNSQEDLINEKILYEEAKKLNITPDTNEHKDIVEKYKFDGDQADFLYRYMTIFAFINTKLADLPTEDVIEQLMVRYDEENKYTKIVLASELQAQAKSGMSFEEIYNLYPELVTFEIAKFEDLEKNIREKVRQIPVGGIGVIWSEEGYRILKPTSRKLSLNPFQELQPVAKEKINGYINELIRGIERGAK